jgi:uncharacterized phage-like protein YoqJ
MANKKSQLIGVTGHRDLSHSPEEIKVYLRLIFEKLNPSCVFIGMAQGFDMIVAEVCCEMNIRYIAVLPFDEMGSNWPKAAQEKLRALILKAISIENICHSGYAKWKYLKRDEWIVNNSEVMLSYLDNRGKGGTYYTVQYCKKNHPEKPTYNLFDIINS